MTKKYIGPLMFYVEYVYDKKNYFSPKTLWPIKACCYPLIHFLFFKDIVQIKHRFELLNKKYCLLETNLSIKVRRCTTI